MTTDYAEILRLHRKYCETESEPLWRVFIRVGQRLEKAKPERCLAERDEIARIILFECSIFESDAEIKANPDHHDVQKAYRAADRIIALRSK